MHPSSVRGRPLLTAHPRMERLSLLIFSVLLGVSKRLFLLYEWPVFQIVVIGSAMGHRHSSHATAYAASKATTWSFVKCLSEELAPFGIAVNEWIPGPLHTSMNTASELCLSVVNLMISYCWTFFAFFVRCSRLCLAVRALVFAQSLKLTYAQDF